MIRYARTYGSKNYLTNPNEAWQYPTGPILDNFGVTVQGLNNTFGLEEFNFNPFYKKSKIAYIPCYGTANYYPRVNKLDELRLIFKLNGRCHFHYATLFNVSCILNTEIMNLRNEIAPHFNDIYLSNNSRSFFGEDFEVFSEIINNMNSSDVIAANHISSPFLVNVRYEKLEILKSPILCEANPGYVNQWKINVLTPGSCKPNL